MLKGFFYAYLISAFALCSCATHSLYVPTITNTPNFDGTNKYQVNAAAGFDHFELQTAANPIPQLGLMHNIYFSNRGRNVDLAIGYTRYDSLKKFGLDVFTGYGMGERKYWDKTKHLSEEHYMAFDIDNSFRKYFIQTSFFKNIKSSHQLGFTFRGSYIDYKWFNYTIDYSTIDNYSSAFNKSDVVKNDDLTVSCFDYMITYKFRYKRVGIFIQPVIQINNGPKDLQKDLHFSYKNGFALNTGINFYFGKRNKD